MHWLTTRFFFWYSSNYYFWYLLGQIYLIICLNYRRHALKHTTVPGFQALSFQSPFVCFNQDVICQMQHSAEEFAPPHPHAFLHKHKSSCSQIKTYAYFFNIKQTTKLRRTWNKTDNSTFLLTNRNVERTCSA